MSDSELPIAQARASLLNHLGQKPIVLSAPTGSGKSTEVPRYCPGRALVVEPRRVACRGLAQRVAQLAGCALGTEVGYRVRDDDQSRADTRILFVTPGIALRMFDTLGEFDHILLDEFHERGMETDLLLALLQQRYRERLVVMSATLDAQRVAEHLSAERIEVSSRTYPIDIRYLGAPAARPDPAQLIPRLVQALSAVLTAEEPGDVLVFLPGKGEIAAAQAALSHLRECEFVPLHGALSLAAQTRAFEPSGRRKVILATNVAETSLTIPGVAVVIDSGLVRRTRYHQGRSYLSLSAIAMDSAAQRAGRAGRTGPGIGLRLWGEAAQLEPMTPPELHREALDQLWLSAALWGESLADLQWLDPPKPHALADAQQDLHALGAIDATGAVTEVGRSLSGLPIDPALGRLLIEARARDCLDDAIDLVACLSVGRPLFQQAVPEDDPLDAGGCDVTALIHVLRRERVDGVAMAEGALHEARRTARKLRQAFALPGGGPKGRFTGRMALALTAMAADPRSVHVVRTRKTRMALANGGTELEVARDSLLHRHKGAEAALVFDARGVGDGHLRTRLIASCTMPIEVDWIVAAGLTKPRVSECLLRRGKLLARVEHVYAKRVLASDEIEPQGDMARDAIARMIASGRLFGAGRDAREARFEALQLAHRVRGRMQTAHVAADDLPAAMDSLEEWLSARLNQLGVEAGADLALLNADDVAGPTLPPPVETYLDENFPVRIDLGDAAYRVEYDFEKRRATLALIRGNRATPPARGFLPRLSGLQVYIEAGGRLHRLG